jgi:hypothetical protein
LIIIHLFVCCVIMKPHAVHVILLAWTLKNVEAPNFDQLRESVTPEDQKSFIKINVLLETPPRVVACQLATAVPESHLAERTVYLWYHDFKERKRTDVSDLPRSGRPRETTTQENIEKVKQLILDSDGMRTEDLIYETGIPQTSLLRLLKEMGARKLKSRWIPHELTERQKHSRYNIAAKHLARYQREPSFLDKIVAIDETWLKSYDPKDARQASEWLLPGQKPLVHTIDNSMFLEILNLTAFLSYAPQPKESEGRT